MLKTCCGSIHCNQMNSKEKQTRDDIFEQSRIRHLITVGFLAALKEKCDPEQAFEIAALGFANYMVNYYKLVLASTRIGSQERFDRFRQHYEEYARTSNHIKIVKSEPAILSVRYERCPFAEVMAEYGVDPFLYAFCLSDYAFTEKVLPGVFLHRDHEIAKGDDYCDHTWIFQK